MVAIAVGRGVRAALSLAKAGSSEGFLVEDAGSQRSGRSVRAQEIITRTARRLVGSLKQREALGLDAQAPESKELSGCRCDEALDSLLATT